MLNLRHGIYLIIFLMLLYLWRFSICGIPTTVLEMMIYVLFLIWVLNKFKISKKDKKIILILKQIKSKSEEQYHSTVYGTVKLILYNHFSKNHCCYSILNIGITLLFLGVIISTFNSVDLRTSLGIFKGWFVDPLLFFIVFINVIKKEKHLVLVLKSWLFSGVAVSLISIFYLLSSDLTFDGRLKAFFLSPNYLAMYLAPVFLIVLFLLLSNSSFLRRQESIATTNNRLGSIQKIKKILNIKYLIFLIIILIPLYFTYSYGAFLGIFVAMIYLFTVGLKPSFRISNIKYSIFLIIISIPLIFITSNKFDQIINSENRSSFHSRLMIWNASVEIIKDSPIFGIGSGTFQDVYLSYAERFDEPYLEWAVPQPHNIFLAFYLQTGIVGFVGFVLILFWFFKNSNNPKNKFNIQYSIFNILTCLMIYILIHGLIDTTYWKNDLALMFWIVVGMMVVSQKILKVSQYKP